MAGSLCLCSLFPWLNFHYRWRTNPAFLEVCILIFREDTALSEALLVFAGKIALLEAYNGLYGWHIEDHAMKRMLWSS